MSRRDRIINLALLQLGQLGPLLVGIEHWQLGVAVAWGACALQLVVGREPPADTRRLAIGVALGTGAEAIAVWAGALQFAHPIPVVGVAWWVPAAWGMVALSAPRILAPLARRPLLTGLIGAAATAALLRAAAATNLMEPPLGATPFAVSCVWLGAIFAVVIRLSRAPTPPPQSP